MDAYSYQAALLCVGCARARVKKLVFSGHSDTGDSDDFPQGPYADGGGEADSPQHCDRCQVFLENPLTSEGRDYVIERLCLPDAADNPVCEQWAEFYDIPTAGYAWDRMDMYRGDYQV